MKHRLLKAGKFLLRHALLFAIFYVFCQFANGLCFGFEAARKLPDHEAVIQVEVISSDPSIVAVTYTSENSVALTLGYLSGYCDYTLWHNEETAPGRLTFLITTENGDVVPVIVGDRTISFNGSVRGLRYEKAAQIMTELLLLE